MMEIVFFFCCWLTGKWGFYVFFCYVLVCLHLNEQIVGKSMWWKNSQKNNRKRRIREPDNDDVALPTMIVKMMIEKKEHSGVYMLVVYGVQNFLLHPLHIQGANYRIFIFPSRITVCRKCWMHLAFV